MGESYPSSHPNPEYDKPVESYEYNEDEDLEEALGHIWDIAKEFHLDPFPTHFEIVPANIMNQIGAYNGLQSSFSHWTRGRQYRQMKTTYDWGMSKIYELVINSNPAQAFLLENNPPIENKFVMAHVLGHTDFFKNNFRFAGTRRDMPEAAARNAERIRGYEESEGRYEVERFLDATLAIEEHIDPYLPHRPSRQEEFQIWRDQAEHARKVRPQVIDEFEDLLGPRQPHENFERGKQTIHVPPTPDRDILGFIRNHAPHLQDWQRDIVDVVRNESVYFFPQRRTKIMNEGWAAYWHKRIMREMGDRDLISDKDNEAWWKVHSGVVAESQRKLNPYYLGMKIYEYLEDYHNGNLTDKENAWLQKEGVAIQPHYEGRLEDSPASAALRDVMIHNDDQSFIRNHFNKIVADRMNLFVYGERTLFDGSIQTYIKSTGWQEIREKLVSSMNNNGVPYIEVIDGDYNNANELYLRHKFDGRQLDPEYVTKTLPYLYTLWQRPLHLETVGSQSDKSVIFTYDGMKVTKKDVA